MQVRNSVEYFILAVFTVLDGICDVSLMPCRNKVLKKGITIPVDLHGLHVDEAIERLRNVLGSLRGFLGGAAPQLSLCVHNLAEPWSKVLFMSMCPGLKNTDLTLVLICVIQSMWRLCG